MDDLRWLARPPSEREVLFWSTALCVLGVLRAVDGAEATRRRDDETPPTRDRWTAEVDSPKVPGSRRGPYRSAKGIFSVWITVQLG